MNSQNPCYSPLEIGGPMNLKHFSNAELITRLEKLTRTERKITHLILWHILEVEDRRLYAELGYDGMYSYLTKGLGYSDGSAYRRLQSARLLKKLPQIADKIESGSLNLTQLTQVQKSLQESRKQGEVISSTKAAEILDKLVHRNTFETQKVLALEFNQSVKISEHARPQQDDSVRLEITLSQKQYQELLQAKSLLSHICHENSWADVIGFLAENYNKQKSQGRIAKSKIQKLAHSESTQSVVATKSAQKIKRQYISKHIQRSLTQKAQHQCEFESATTHKRCGSQSQLQMDHIQPLAKNGSNDVSNLRILCRVHNLLEAQKLGLGKYMGRPR